MTEPGAAALEAEMRLALSLGEQALGRTSPNPPVGAVVLDAAGIVVGSGNTQPPGRDHAEVVALREAGTRAAGGTAVVTLEPCNHTGRTPPCVNALLAAGIARVVYAVDDPTAVAAGGAQRLRAAGVEVVGGAWADEAAEGALRWWLRAVGRGRPAVIWKFASTLDGRVAAADGTSRWISSPDSRADVHLLRARVDAVAVGSGTALADDPSLTARDRDGVVLAHQPLRVVLDRGARVPATAAVFDAAAETLVLREADPRSALDVLWRRGVRSVLLEGGPTVAGAFLAAGCVDDVVAYLAPSLLGDGPQSLGTAGIATISEAVALELRTVERIGPDLKLTARVT